LVILKLFFIPEVTYTSLFLVIKIASIPFKDSISLILFSSPIIYTPVDSPSPSIELSEIIVELMTSLSEGYPVLGSIM
jgi:hypothetical protein